MSDASVFALIFMFLMILPLIIQCIFFKVFSSPFIRNLPFATFVLAWFFCILGAFDIVNTPLGTNIIDGGFITFRDVDVLAVVGIPVFCGFIISWVLCNYLKKKKL